MYTYIITVIIAFIAATCILKIRKNSDGNSFLTMGIIFAILGIVSVSAVNLFRQNSLPTEDTIVKGEWITGFNVDTTTTYTRYDTTGGKLTIEKTTVKPDTMRNVQTSIVYTKAHAKFLNSDTIVVFPEDGDPVLFTNFEINLNTKSFIETHSIDRVSDNWSCGWAIPRVREYNKLMLTKTDIEYLKLSNPKAFAKWKINP